VQRVDDPGLLPQLLLAGPERFAGELQFGIGRDEVVLQHRQQLVRQRLAEVARGAVGEVGEQAEVQVQGDRAEPLGGEFGDRVAQHHRGGEHLAVRHGRHRRS
jgi:hypothetical protein